MNHEQSESYLLVLRNKAEAPCRIKNKEDHTKMARTILNDVFQQAFGKLQIHQEKTPIKPGQNWSKYLRLSRLSLTQKQNYLRKKARKQRHQTGEYKEAFANFSYRATKIPALFNLLNTTHCKILTQSDKL